MVRTTCLLLLLLALALAANFWIDGVAQSFNSPHGLQYSSEADYGHENFDFLQYYAGGHNWSLGLDPYANHPGDPRAMLLPRIGDFSISGYIYPPTYLPVYAAFSRLPYGLARTLWLALDLAALAGAIIVATLTARRRRLAIVTAAVLLVVGSYPFMSHVYQGQIDMLVAGLSVSAFLLYPRWRGWPSAACLALAVAAKVTPVLLLAVIVLYFWDWRFLLKSALCGGILFVSSLPFIGLALYREFVFTTLPKVSVPQASLINQTSLRYLANHPSIAQVATVAGYAALLGLAALVGRSSRHMTEGRRPVPLDTERYAVLTLGVSFMLFFSPLAWQMAYVWLIVPLALLITAAPPPARPGAVIWLGVGTALASVQVFAGRVIDMLNIIGLGVLIVVLLLCYLPLGDSVAPEGRSPTGLRQADADGARTPEGRV